MAMQKLKINYNTADTQLNRYLSWQWHIYGGRGVWGHIFPGKVILIFLLKTIF